jgi:Tol biopolymer transport system component
MRAFRIAIALSTLSTLMAVGATNASATFPGREGRIAFADYLSGEVFAVNPDGTKLRKLTHVGGSKWQAGQPSWSPSGRRLIFSRSASEFDPARIWVVRAHGTHQHRLARDAKGFRDLDPAFTPNGRRVVFARCKPDDGVCAIWKMRVDGSRMHALTAYKEGLNERVDFNPSVSPNGKRIAFTRFFAGGITSRVYVMGAGGRNPHPITPAELEGVLPDWDPRGRSITFTSNSQRLGSSVFTINPDGTGLRQITPTRFPHNDALSAYSPRADRLAFISDRNYSDICCNDLFTIGADGAGEQLIGGGFPNRGIIDPAWGTAPQIR